jgi:hypothetical protein
MSAALLKRFSPAKAWVIGSKAKNAARSVIRTDARFEERLVIISYISFFNKNLLSLEVSIGKPLLYVKEILPQNVVLDTTDRSGGK